MLGLRHGAGSSGKHCQGYGCCMNAHLAQRAQQLKDSSFGRKGGDEQQRAVAALAAAAHNGHPDLPGRRKEMKVRHSVCVHTSVCATTHSDRCCAHHHIPAGVRDPTL